MLEGVIAGILKQYLGEFVLGLDADQLSISVFSGALELKDLNIHPKALENAGLKLPIALKAGTVGKLEISGLKNMTTQPVKAVLEDVYLNLGPNSAFEWTEDDEAESKLATKKGLLTARMDQATNAKAAEKKANEDLSWAEKLTAKIIDNIQLDIKRIHIRYEDAHTCPGTTFAIGVMLRSLSIYSTDDQWVRGFMVGQEVTHKCVKLDEISVYFRTDTTEYNDNVVQMKKDFGTIAEEKNHETTAVSAKTTSLREWWDKNMLIPPISFQARVSMCKTEKDQTRAKVLVSQVVEDVNVIFSRRQFQLLIELLKYFDNYTATQKYRQYRPVVPVQGNTKVWWHFALKCILANRREEHAEQRRKMFVVAKSEKYMLLHERSMLITEQWMSNPTKEQWEELTQIEEDPRMHVEDIIQNQTLVEAKVLHRLQFNGKNKNIKPWQLQLRRDSSKAKKGGEKALAAQKKADEKKEKKEAKKAKKQAKKNSKESAKKKKKKKKKSGGWGWGFSKKKTVESSSSSEEEEEGNEEVGGDTGGDNGGDNGGDTKKESDAYSFSEEERAKLFKDLNFDPDNAAKDHAERMRTLPSSYELLNVNMVLKMVSLTLVNDNNLDQKKPVLRLELPMTRINLGIKNGLLQPDGTPSPNIVLRAKLPDLVVRDFTNPDTLFPDMVKRASLESSFGEDNDPSGLDALDALTETSGKGTGGKCGLSSVDVCCVWDCLFCYCLRVSVVSVVVAVAVVVAVVAVVSCTYHVLVPSCCVLVCCQIEGKGWKTFVLRIRRCWNCWWISNQSMAPATPR